MLMVTTEDTTRHRGLLRKHSIYALFFSLLYPQKQGVQMRQLLSSGRVYKYKTACVLLHPSSLAFRHIYHGVRGHSV